MSLFGINLDLSKSKLEKLYKEKVNNTSINGMNTPNSSTPSNQLNNSASNQVETLDLSNETQKQNNTSSAIGSKTGNTNQINNTTSQNSFNNAKPSTNNNLNTPNSNGGFSGSTFNNSNMNNAKPNTQTSFDNYLNNKNINVNNGSFSKHQNIVYSDVNSNKGNYNYSEALDLSDLANLHKYGFTNLDVARIKSGKITIAQIIDEIENDSDNTRRRLLMESAYLNKFDCECYSLNELANKIKNDKIELEKLQNTNHNSNAALVYVLDRLKDGADLDTILNSNVIIGYTSTDLSGNTIFHFSDEEVTYQIDEAIYLNDYITDDMINDLKSRLTKTEKVSGIINKEVKDVYVWNDSVELDNYLNDLRNNYNGLTKETQNKINELKTEIAQNEFIIDYIKNETEYQMTYVDSYLKQEDFIENSKFNDKSLDVIEGIYDRIDNDYQKNKDLYADGIAPSITISDKEEMVAILSCMLNDKGNLNTSFIGDKVKYNWGTNDEVFSHFLEWKEFFTEDEKKVFNYIYNTEGTDAAYKYLENIANEFDNRWLANETEKDTKFAEEHEFLASAASIITKPIDGVAATASSMAAYINGDKIRRSDIYSNGDVWRSAISNELVRDNHATAAFWYNTGMSMADSVALIGLNAATAGTISAPLAFTLMGTSAYTSTLNDALDRGLSDGKAIALAWSSACVETAMESYSLGHLMNLEESLGKGVIDMAAKISNPVAQKTFYILAGAVSQGLAEGEEEFATEILNYIFDELISGDLSAHTISIEEYIRKGMSEDDARALANKDFLVQIKDAFIGGFASGCIFGTFSSAKTTHQVSKQIAKDINNEYSGLSKSEAFTKELNDSLEENNKLQEQMDSLKEARQQEFREKTKNLFESFKSKFSYAKTQVESKKTNTLSEDNMNIFKETAEQSEFSSMKRIYDVLNKMINSNDVITRNLAENFQNIKEGNLSKLFFINRLSDYSRSAFAHYDSVSYGTGSAFILNPWISNEVTAHEFGHMLFDVLDKQLPMNYNEVIKNTLSNLENNKETVESFLKEALEYKQQFNSKEKEKIEKYFEEHPGYLQELANDIIDNRVAVESLANEIHLDDKNKEILLRGFDNHETEKLNGNLIALLKYRETIKSIYEASIYDHQMQQIDMITGIIDSIYNGNNPYYDMFIDSGFNGFRYHSEEYFKKDTKKSFDEQIADYTAIRIYSDEYSVAKTFLENVLGKEWFDMMDNKFTELSNKISTTNIENYIQNNASIQDAEAANSNVEMPNSEISSTNTINLAEVTNLMREYKETRNIQTLETIIEEYSNVADDQIDGTIKGFITSMLPHMSMKNTIKLKEYVQSKEMNSTLLNHILNEINNREKLDEIRNSYIETTRNRVFVADNPELAFGKNNPNKLVTSDNSIYRSTQIDQLEDILESGYVRPKGYGSKEYMKDQVFWTRGGENLFYTNPTAIILEVSDSKLSDNQIGAVSINDLSGIWVYEDGKFVNKINDYLEERSKNFGEGISNKMENTSNLFDKMSTLFSENKKDKFENSLPKIIDPNSVEHISIKEQNSFINKVNLEIQNNGFAKVAVINTSYLTSSMLDRISDLSKVSIQIFGGFSNLDGNFKSKYQDARYISRITYTGLEARQIVYRIEQLESMIDKTATKIDKVKQIYDIIANEIPVRHDFKQYEHNQEIMNIFQSLKGITSYNKLASEGLICAGYAQVFKELCNRCGIVCDYVRGKAKFDPLAEKFDGGHAWNVVVIDNNIIPIDVTWQAAMNQDWFGYRDDFESTHVANQDEMFRQFDNGDKIMISIVNTLTNKYNFSEAMDRLLRYADEKNPNIITRDNNARENIKLFTTYRIKKVVLDYIKDANIQKYGNDGYEMFKRFLKTGNPDSITRNKEARTIAEKIKPSILEEYRKLYQ